MRCDIIYNILIFLCCYYVLTLYFWFIHNCIHFLCIRFLTLLILNVFLSYFYKVNFYLKTFFLLSIITSISCLCSIPVCKTWKNKIKIPSRLNVKYYVQNNKCRSQTRRCDRQNNDPYFPFRFLQSIYDVFLSIMLMLILYKREKRWFP